MERTVRYDVERMRDDMAAKGWQATDLARRCRPKTFPSSVTRFFSGEHQTARMAKRISRALGHDAGFYLIRSSSDAAA